MTHRPRALAVALCALALGATAPAALAATSDAVAVRDCGETLTFPSPAERVFVNDGNMIAMALALKVAKQVVAVTRLERDTATLTRYYGAPAVRSLKEVSPDYPSLEVVLAERPDVVIAGWNSGWDEAKNVTPETLRRAGIAAYTHTESCRQPGSRQRGFENPWVAVKTDLTNLGRIFGAQAQATRLVTNLDRRLRALRRAPKPARQPTVFLFDGARARRGRAAASGRPRASSARRGPATCSGATGTPGTR